MSTPSLGACSPPPDTPFDLCSYSALLSNAIEPYKAMPVGRDLAAAAALATAGLGYFIAWRSFGGPLGPFFWVLHGAVSLSLSKTALWWASGAALGLFAAARLLRTASARRQHAEGSGESEEAKSEPGEPSQSTAAQAEQSAATILTTPLKRRVSTRERTEEASTHPFECPRTFERQWTREFRTKPLPVTATSGPAHSAPTTPGPRIDRHSVIEAYKRDPYALDVASLADLLRDGAPRPAPTSRRRAETHPSPPFAPNMH